MGARRVRGLGNTSTPSTSASRTRLRRAWTSPLIEDRLPPTPRQLFRLLDSGAISRAEFREAMAHHARSLIEEMEEVRRHPLAAWVDGLLNRRAAARLARRHGEALVRELLVALSDVPGFPLANWLWNADQPTVPLHCFVRSRSEPVFRVLKIVSAPFVLTMTLEHGSARRGGATREQFTFGRDRFGRLAVQARVRLP